MIYREAGEYKTNYRADQQIFPIRQDRWVMFALLMMSIFVVPFVAGEYWLTAVIIPTLALSLVAIGLNILTGYCGQLSVGAAAFMMIGAFFTYNFLVRLPWIPFPISIVLSGLIAGLAGLLIGLPSLRVKGFYMVVVTFLAHFFFTWLFNTVKWFKGYRMEGEINTAPLKLFGFVLDTPQSQYLFTLSFVIVLTFLAKNMMRCEIGRRMMAIRDMEVAARAMGIPVARTKLTAFAISSFYCGVGGSLFIFCYLRLLDTKPFSLEIAFSVLFMIIVGGLGSILGSFLGTAFIFLLPIFLNSMFGRFVAGAAELQNVSKMIFGGVVVLILIIEPKGIANIWVKIKARLRHWPFAY